MVTVTKRENRVLPWRNGVNISTARSVAEALHMAQLDWRVEKEPLYIRSNTQDYYEQVPVLGNVRQEDRRLLGVVKDKYKVVNNVDAFAFIDSILDSETKLIAAGQVNDGAMVYMLAELPQQFILNEQVKNYLLFVNGFDGKTGFRVVNTPVRFVCYNTLAKAIGAADFNAMISHTGEELPERITDRAIEALTFNHQYMRGLELDAEVLSQAKLDVDDFINTLYPLNETMPEKARVETESMHEAIKMVYSSKDGNLLQFQGTAWAAYNAALEVIQHKALKRIQKGSDNKRMRNLITGTTENNRISQVIYDMIGREAA